MLAGVSLLGNWLEDQQMPYVDTILITFDVSILFRAFLFIASSN